MKIEVYASNTHVSKKDMDGKVVVAVDTLRAATTIITALHNGCAQIIRWRMWKRPWSWLPTCS